MLAALDAVSLEKATPYKDKVFVRRLPIEESIGGIVIPETGIEKNLFCEIVKVGTGTYYKGEHRPIPVKVGDTVIVRQYNGVEVDITKTDFLVIDAEDIEGIYRDGQ